jgi:hypothetical protein
MVTTLERPSRKSLPKPVFGGSAEHSTRPLPAYKPHIQPYIEQRSSKKSAANRWLKLVTGLALLAIGGRFIGWTAQRVDHQMRNQVFLQAQMTAQAIDIRNVIALSGTENDLGSPQYQRVKEQLTLIRQVDPKCRFIYLMGRGPDGKIFFFVDSESPGSDDYSPPGQAYDEATDNDRRVFTDGSGNVEGPYKDRWGLWISAMVPIFHPDTKNVLAALGMDFNAATWKWDVATGTALPALPGVLTMLLGLYILAFPCRIAWS